MPSWHLVRLWARWISSQIARKSGAGGDLDSWHSGVSTWGWYYLNAGHRQHAVEAAELTNFPMQSALCGCQILGALPAVAKWHNDPKGLVAREKCKQCIKILEREQPKSV